MAPTSTAPHGAPTSTVFDGYSFSNNLFSDLAPLLTLFGEQVTKQFLSLTLGWADHILLAMGPLGIITIVVSAIRVSGHKKLKAIIGRARESLTIAEVELLSSTSHDVCELWNGSQIVRTIGEPKYMKEFISLTKRPSDNEHERLLDLEDALSQRLLRADPPVLENVLQKLTKQPPNITLNVAGATSSKLELWACAAMGFTLQTSALIVIGLTVYSWKWEKGEEDIATYGYPCFLSGSLAIIIGAVGCSYVIDKRTKEITFRPDRSYGMWSFLRVQKACTVGDQHFQSYAIMNDPSDRVLRTSRLRSENKGHWTFFAAASTAITITGYIVQFVGLRALHWSATIIQLGVTLAMTCCRAWVRRGLASQPTCVPLEETREAMCLTLLFGGGENSLQAQKDPFKLNSWRICGWELHNLNESFEWQPIARPKTAVGHYETSGIIKLHQKLCKTLEWPPSCEWSNRLCLAVESIMRHITSTEGISIKQEGGIASKTALSWEIMTTRELPTAKNIDHGKVGHLRAGVAFRSTDDSNGQQEGSMAWKVDPSEIKSIMDLWAFSVNQKADLQRTCPLPGGILYHSYRETDPYQYQAFLGRSQGKENENSYLERRTLRHYGVESNRVSSEMKHQEVSEMLGGAVPKLATDDANEFPTRFKVNMYNHPLRQICALELLRLFLSAIFSEISAIKGTTRSVFASPAGTAIAAIASNVVGAELVKDDAEAYGYVVSALSEYNLLPGQTCNYPLSESPTDKSLM